MVRLFLNKKRFKIQHELVDTSSKKQQKMLPCLLAFCLLSSISFSSAASDKRTSSALCKPNSALFAVVDPRRETVVKVDLGIVAKLVMNIQKIEIPCLLSVYLDVLVPTLFEMLGKALSASTLEGPDYNDIKVSPAPLYHWYSYHDKVSEALLSDLWLWRINIFMRQVELDATLQLASLKDRLLATSVFGYNSGMETFLRIVEGDADVEGAFLGAYRQQQCIIAKGRALDVQVSNLQARLARYDERPVQYPDNARIAQ